MFALQNVPPLALRAPELLVTPLEPTSGTSMFDLTLFATEVPEGLRLSLEYSTDLFDAATVDRMLAHYQLLLEEVIADPDQPIGAIPMLTAEERTQIFMGWDAESVGEFAAEFDGTEDDNMESQIYKFSRTELAPDE
jgi:non-ribosomal peptide synthetase component F